VFKRLHAPALGEATERLHCEPLGPAELRQLVRESDAVRERTLEITFLESGAEAYAFTFG
jgi:thioredoxin family protein